MKGANGMANETPSRSSLGERLRGVASDVLPHYAPGTILDGIEERLADLDDIDRAPGQGGPARRGRRTRPVDPMVAAHRLCMLRDLLRPTEAADLVLDRQRVELERLRAEADCVRAAIPARPDRRTTEEEHQAAVAAHWNRKLCEVDTVGAMLTRLLAEEKAKAAEWGEELAHAYMAELRTLVGLDAVGSFLDSLDPDGGDDDDA